MMYKEQPNNAWLAGVRHVFWAFSKREAVPVSELARPPVAGNTHW